MKNILARGGIEFLAVLLGITASLWIDKNQNQNENESERIKILTSLQMEIDEINNYMIKFSYFMHFILPQFKYKNE